MKNTNDYSELKQQIEDEINRQQFWWYWDFTTSQVCILGTVLSSVIAAIGTGISSGGWYNYIAAVPALLISVESSFKFSARAAWHTAKITQLRSLVYRLVYQQAPALEIARDFIQTTETLDRAWNRTIANSPFEPAETPQPVKPAEPHQPVQPTPIGGAHQPAEPHQ